MNWVMGAAMFAIGIVVGFVAAIAWWTEE